MLTTKKALECMAIIKKYSKDFGGSLEDLDVIKLCGCSRNSHYNINRRQSQIKENVMVNQISKNLKKHR
jgi:hypothetical protein